MCGDVGEREVVADEGECEDGGGSERREEARRECIARRVGETPPVRLRGERPDDERVDEQPEADDQCRAAEISHGRYADGVFAVYFDGHFVTMSCPASLPSPNVPVTTTLRPTLKSGGGAAPR